MRPPLARPVALIALLVASAAAVALTACTTTEPADESEGSIVLVHDQAAGDGSVIDSQIAGMTEVGESLGFSTQAVFVADPANYQSTLENVAATDPTIVITSFPRIADAFATVAEANPEIQFIHLYAEPVEPPLANLLTVTYDNYEVMYLSGVFAGTFSATGKVGWIGGDTQPMMAADFNAFSAGALSADPDIEVVAGVVGSWDDANKGQTVANQLFESGADIVQAEAGGADAGVIASVLQDPARYMLGESLGAFDAAQGQVLGVGGLEFADSVIETVQMVLEPDYAGGAYATGVGDVLKFTVAEVDPADADAATRFAAAAAAVEEAAAGLASASIDVPFETQMP